MDKFEKALRVKKQPPKKPVPSHELKGIDPLHFTVRTTRGQIYAVDLRRYRDGDAASGIGGSETLSLDLLPSIKDAIDGVRSSPRAISSWIHRRLPKLFAFVTYLEAETGIALETSSDFSNVDGVILKEFLLRENINPLDRRKYFTAIRTLLSDARGPDAETLHWPDIEVGPDLRVHDDVNPAALKEIYHACKRILDTAENQRRRGEEWKERGIRPDQIAFEPVRPAGRRGSIQNEAWIDPANLSVLARDIIIQRVTGKDLVCTSVKQRLLRHTDSRTKSYAGILTSEAYAANAPTALEVSASVLIVSMETGWIDAVAGIDLSSNWYTVRRGGDLDNLAKTDSVALHSRRPKTSKEVTAIGLAGARFRSFQVIRALQRRSEFLRECLLDRREILKSEMHLAPSEAEIATSEVEIAEIDFRLKSPWLFFNSKNTGVKAVGIISAFTVRRNLKAIIEAAVDALSSRKKSNDTLIKSIRSFRWSDARDGFAAHLYEQSKGNVFVVQRALGHNNVSTTRHYVRQKRMLRQRFDAFRDVMQSIINELSSGRMLDPTILFLSLHQSDFGPKDRENLIKFRTRMGMGCANPTSPPVVIAPGHREGAYCAVQRCILCRHGVIFADAYDGLAKRHAELIWLRSNSNAMRWLTSSFSWELEAIELVRDELFTHQIEHFKDRSKAHLEAIKRGETFVFDEPELRGLLSR